MATETGSGGGVVVVEGKHAPEAERVFSGADTLEKAVGILIEHGLPDGLLPMQDVVECGYNRATGYVWVTQKKAIVHHFKQISKQVSYGEKITAFLEKGRLKKLTGVKAKELFWVSIVDIAIDDSDPEKIFFKSFAGIGKVFPVKAFARGA